MNLLSLPATLLLSCLCLTAQVNALWPIPRNLETGDGYLKLAPEFDIQFDFSAEGRQYPFPSDLFDAIERTKTRLWTDKHQRLVPGRGDADVSHLTDAHTPSLALLTLNVLNPAENWPPAPIAIEATKDILERDEGYSLDVPADGSPARIEANSSLGLLRGLTTFEQLWYWTPVGEEGGAVYSTDLPVVVKEDKPAFPYRGFMLDTARNFFPVSDIKRTLDAMSLVKMSMFHWHVVDSQSFPLEVPGFMDLSQNGAYSRSETYSTKDVKEITRYAAERGIDVVMEIDIPGHTAVIANSYPEHIACPHSSPWNKYANEPPAGQLRLASEATTTFTASLLGAILELLPGSSMFSTGGDEINTNCYKEDKETQESLVESGRTLEEALDVFTGKMHQVVKDAGKRVVVWEEMALEHDVKLANDTVVMVWISAKNAAKVAKKGFHLVHAPSDYFYLDCGGGEWIPLQPLWCALRPGECDAGGVSRLWYKLSVHWVMKRLWRWYERATLLWETVYRDDIGFTEL